MSRACLAVLMLMATFSAGCGPGKVTGGAWRGASWTRGAEAPVPGIHSGSADLITLTAGPAAGTSALLWSDVSRTAATTRSDRGGAVAEGQYQSEAKVPVGYRIETADGVRAKVTIGRQTFDTNNGRLFLISTQNVSRPGDEPVVRQLDADVDDFPREADAIIRYGLERPDIVEFFQAVNSGTGVSP